MCNQFFKIGFSYNTCEGWHLLTWFPLTLSYTAGYNTRAHGVPCIGTAVLSTHSDRSGGGLPAIIDDWDVGNFLADTLFWDTSCYHSVQVLFFSRPVVFSQGTGGKPVSALSQLQ